jgi:hypothetical protein
MSLADTAPLARSANGSRRPEVHPDGSPGNQCPFHGDTFIGAQAPAISRTPDGFDTWLETGLQCSAGKREFRLGRYFVTRFAQGREYAEALAAFRREVAAYRKTGFLAIFDHEGVCRTAEEELRLLGAAMFDADLTDDYDALISGETLAHAFNVACPVTGRDTSYEFFSVAFCRHAAEPSDPLYDPSLSAPFTAVNTTSDAFAFARFVNDNAIRAWGVAPYEMTHDRDAVELLFRRCIVAWQNMSTTTIQNYGRVAVDPARGVHLSDDRTRWFAAHNDPVFAELKKCPHVHEMPVAYATRLAAKWSATLFDNAPYVPGRDGQSGGVPVSANSDAVERLSGELF